MSSKRAAASKRRAHQEESSEDESGQDELFAHSLSLADDVDDDEVGDHGEVENGASDDGSDDLADFVDEPRDDDDDDDNDDDDDQDGDDDEEDDDDEEEAQDGSSEGDDEDEGDENGEYADDSSDSDDTGGLFGESSESDAEEPAEKPAVKQPAVKTATNKSKKQATDIPITSEQAGIDEKDIDGYLNDPNYVIPQPKEDPDTKLKAPEVTKGPIQVEESDPETSDDELHSRNTIGKIPRWWYDELDHQGYDLRGRKIAKSAEKKDKLDKFLDSIDNEDYGRTIVDPNTGEEIVLGDDEIDLIKRIQGGLFPESHVDPYEPTIEWVTSEKMVTPINIRPEPKRRFLPSKWEHEKVMKLVRAIRKGLIKPPVKKEQEFFMIWNDNDEPTQRNAMYLPAPKTKLPGHAESYNPPPEYLLTPEEQAEWEAKDPSERFPKFLPQKYSSLREVPAYKNFINERFHRCLDLYLCPRVERKRERVDPQSLIPKIPRPSDFRPFPSNPSIMYLGHTDVVTTIAVDPSGQWLASGSDDCTVRIWEVATTRCVMVYETGQPVTSVQFNPNPALTLLAIAAGSKVLLMNPKLGPIGACNATDTMLKNIVVEKSETAPIIEWQKASDEEYARGLRYTLPHKCEVRQVTWHQKGNYFSTVMPEGPSQVVLVHALQRLNTQTPFQKKNIDVQCVSFHPTKPLFFVATKKMVRVYNLQDQQLIKKLNGNTQWISSISVHPQGDNVIIGTYDRKLCWFDMDLSQVAYKTLRYHRSALRQVTFHKNYPLFASCSDDATVHIFHGMVYNDLLQNPLIVPVKILRGHTKLSNGLGVMDCQFHPKQPWIFTAGADKTIRLFT